MTWGEDAIGYRDLAGDDTLTGQWGLLSGKRRPYGRPFCPVAVSAVRRSPGGAGSPEAAAPAAGPG